MVEECYYGNSVFNRETKAILKELGTDEASVDADGCSMRMSELFAEFFRNFWDLPDDFDFELSGKVQRSLDNRFDSGPRPMWDNFTRRHEMWTDIEYLRRRQNAGDRGAPVDVRLNCGTLNMSGEYNLPAADAA